MAAVLVKWSAIELCLMDIPDDWGKEYDIALYEQTCRCSLLFRRTNLDMPDIGVMGNHDLSYLWQSYRREYRFNGSIMNAEKIIGISGMHLSGVQSDRLCPGNR